MAHFQEEEEDPLLYHLTALPSLEPVGFFSHFQTHFFSPIEVLNLVFFVPFQS